MNFDLPIPTPGALPFPIAGAQPAAAGTDGFAALLEIGAPPATPVTTAAPVDAAPTIQKAEIAIAKAGALVGQFLETPDTILPVADAEPETAPQTAAPVNVVPLPVAMPATPRKAATPTREAAKQPETKTEAKDEAPAQDAEAAPQPAAQAEPVVTVLAAPVEIVAAPVPPMKQAKKVGEIILVADNARPAPKPVAALPAPATPGQAARAAPMPAEAQAAAEPVKADESVESDAVETAVVDAAPAAPKRDAVRQIFVADAPLPAEAPAAKAERPAQPAAPAAPLQAAATPQPQAAKPVRAARIEKPETVEALATPLAPLARAAADVQPVLPATAPVAATQQAAPADTVVERQLDLVRNEQWLGDLARDIAETAKGGDTLAFKLMPPQLGRLDIGLTRHHEGISLSIRTETESARAILTAAQPHLAEEIRATGLKLTDTQMFAGDNRQQQGSQAAARAEALIEAAIPVAAETTEAERDEARDGRYA